jgi:hypothetical protein
MSEPTLEQDIARVRRGFEILRKTYCGFGPQEAAFERILAKSFEIVPRRCEDPNNGALTANDAHDANCKSRKGR